MNTRLLGAAVLIALAVLFIPMFFSGKPPVPGDQTVNLAIPQAPDRELQTRTMSLNPDAPASTTVQSAQPAAPGASSDRLPTVNIGSNRPRDVETDPQAGAAPQPTTITTGSGTSPTQPVIPMRGKAASDAAATAPITTPTPVAAKPAPTATPVTAEKNKPAVTAATATPASPTPAAAAASAADAQGSYRLNLSAYASAANAAALQRKVQGLGYPASSHVASQRGKQLTQVMAGPFATRTAAEAARLKIAQKVPGVQPHLTQSDAAASAPPPAAPGATRAATSAAASVPTAGPAAAAEAGGWAVQLAALGSQSDANAMRDKLRSAGFDGYVSSVQVGGKQLWQVRAGPQTQRADAQRVHDQIKAKLGMDGVVRQVP